ncbi:ligase-associated DNA damage response endonuclease PdeM [Glaciecola sp. XM2]|uniref:ligase-associated DNA damage response endonuclease PdeM n=1 Tax=Glaciecola sp. XM2 TaxID=1914931 RepID=UPI001BDE40E5|nr:ligase-associated DNA damage response endonuclease PdeM [Glaciecola sp. XM2]MBT1451197.1 ligase-associated DNA damage response endonuclease PdeM [Glaciecola sp. XM2]
MINVEIIKNLVLENMVIPVNFAQYRMVLDGRGVLYWPKHDVLVFSDLHFEKGSFLTQFAHPLPRFDTKETIHRMMGLVQQYQPKKVICLGDSFHDGNAGKRIERKEIEAINTLVEGVEQWIWILGNHDPDIPEQLLGTRNHHLILDGILFVHEPEVLEQYAHCHAQVVGHYHPKTRYRLVNQYVSGKSFCVGETLLLMPAFGKYTGGLSSDDPVIKKLFGNASPQILMSYHHKLYML